jgi:hypothetical protein
VRVDVELLFPLADIYCVDIVGEVSQGLQLSQTSPMDWHDVINCNLIQQERIHSISPTTRRIPCCCLCQPDVTRFENEFRWVFEF